SLFTFHYSLFTFHPSPFTFPSPSPSVFVQTTVRFRTLFQAFRAFPVMYKGFAELAHRLYRFLAKYMFMLGNFLKIAFRNLLRNKIYSFINIAGLSLGLACAMLIIL